MCVVIYHSNFRQNGGILTRETQMSKLELLTLMKQMRTELMGTDCQYVIKELKLHITYLERQYKEEYKEEYRPCRCEHQD